LGAGGHKLLGGAGGPFKSCAGLDDLFEWSVAASGVVSFVVRIGRQRRLFVWRLVATATSLATLEIGPISSRPAPQPRHYKFDNRGFHDSTICQH